MSESKKQNFLQGTALLAMATAIVKVIGAIYKIPLNAIIGKQGFSYYSTAYEIYNVLLMISTAGLPVAMSRMISQASYLNDHAQTRRVYNTSRTIFLMIGTVSAANSGSTISKHQPAPAKSSSSVRLSAITLSIHMQINASLR